MTSYGNKMKNFPTFLEFLLEEVGIANNDIYLANMAKSFGDKAWFLKYIPKGVDMIVDFGGGTGEFAEYCMNKTGDTIRYVVIDNNPSFLSTAKDKGIMCYASLQELLKAEGEKLQSALLVLSSVIHEIYSYQEEFGDAKNFWTDIKNCHFRAIAIRDMSIAENSFKNIPVEATLWVYQNIFCSDKITYKGKPFVEITRSFEEVWGPLCDLQLKKVNVKQLFHFLIKYRYQANWEREVKEDYLPITQDKLQKWLTSFMSYSLVHKESSHLAFYDDCWTKDFKLNRPDNGNYKKTFQAWLKSLSTHIKWLAA